MESANAAAPTHLVVLVNGIWGGVWDWKRFMERALAHPAAGAVLVHASLVNSALATGDGIDVCGARLAQEVMRLVNDHPSITDISFVGHSMGGLIARYALGLLDGTARCNAQHMSSWGQPLQPAQQAVQGAGSPGTLLGGRLRARCFITIATPHLACASTHPEEATPVWLGSLFMRTLHAIAGQGWVEFPQDQQHPHHQHQHRRRHQHNEQQQNGRNSEQQEVQLDQARRQARLQQQQQHQQQHQHQQQLQQARGVHSLLRGPHAALANRSVAQLLTMDRMLLPLPAQDRPPHIDPAAAQATVVAVTAGVHASQAADGDVETLETAAAAVAVAAEATEVDQAPLGAGPQAPLLDIMTQDWPGLTFISGLAAFDVLAAFSTAGGDHLIPWPSSSIRSAEELPAFTPRPWMAADPIVLEECAAASNAKGAEGRSEGSTEGASSSVGSSSGSSSGGDDAGAGYGSSEKLPGTPRPQGKHQRCLGMRGRLAALKQLPWRRYDVVWPRWAVGFAHNTIQMNGGFFSGVGARVADRVIALLVEE